MVVWCCRVDDQISQSSKGRPEVRRIGKLALQAWNQDQQAIYPHLFQAAATVLSHSGDNDNGEEQRRGGRLPKESDAGLPSAGHPFAAQSEEPTMCRLSSVLLPSTWCN